MLLIDMTSQGSSIAEGQKTRKAALCTATSPHATRSSSPTWLAAFAAVSNQTAHKFMPRTEASIASGT